MIPAAEYVAVQAWTAADALVPESRNYQIDRDALAAALRSRRWVTSE